MKQYINPKTGMCKHDHQYYCGLCEAELATKCKHGNPFYCGLCWEETGDGRVLDEKPVQRRDLERQEDYTHAANATKEWNEIRLAAKKRAEQARRLQSLPWVGSWLREAADAFDLKAEMADQEWSKAIRHELSLK